MVSLRNIIAFVAVAIPVIAQATPAQVVDNINAITSKVQALQGPAQSINTVNAPLFIIGQGPLPEIIEGFTDIATSITAHLDQMQGKPETPAGAPSDDIFEAYGVFVKVQQQLLNIMIDRAGVITKVPLIGPPVVVSLRELEAEAKALSVIYIKDVPSRASDIQNEANSLSASFIGAIQRYDGLLNIKKRATPISRVRRAMIAAV